MLIKTNLKKVEQQKRKVTHAYTQKYTHKKKQVNRVFLRPKLHVKRKTFA